MTNEQLNQLATAIGKVGVLKKAPVALYALAKTQDKLKVHLTRLQGTLDDLRKEHFQDAQEVKDGDERIPAFNAAVKAVLNVDEDFPLHKFTIEQLNLEENAMDTELLRQLLPLIKDE